MSTASEQSPQPQTTGEPISVPLRPSLAVRRWLWLLYAIAWTTALLMPVPFRLPPESGWLVPLFTFSKLLHICAYALFTGLSAWLRLAVPYRWLLLVLLVGHGMLTEYLQFLMRNISHRTGQWSDVVLDCFGISLGAALTWKWWRADGSSISSEPPGLSQRSE